LRLEREFIEAEHLNSPTTALVGRTGIIEEAIVAGRGRLKIDETTWSVEGPDMPAGTRAKIAGARGTVLMVVPD
jgi:membrane protein implicated in regulation of membrane protease activity